MQMSSPFVVTVALSALLAGPRANRSALVMSEVREVVVEVGEKTVHALCTPGPRRVLILHDVESDADAWRPVLARFEPGLGVCVFERPSYGDDSRRHGGRGWFELLDELRRTHAALGFAQGYVLVGHGVGGLYARLFVADRPKDVAGLVLIDPAHEELPGRMRTGMPAEEFDRWMRKREAPNDDGLREEDLGTRARRVRLPDIPLTVVTATQFGLREGWDERFLAEAARQVHASLLRGITVSRHVPASRSGHDIPRDQPDLIVEEVIRVVGASQR